MLEFITPITKNMRIFSAIITLILSTSVFGQTPTTYNEPVIIEDARRVITTGVPFLLIASDARAAGLGDMGVATSVDAHAQQWNPSKYAFSEAKSGIAISYTPYLSKLVNDISISSVNYFNRISERSAFAFGLKYFSLGEIELRENEFSEPRIEKPNELALDASYALRLSDQFSMAVALRYIRSDLKIQEIVPNAKAASTFAVDIAGYYQSEEVAYSDFNGRWRAGFALQNLGPKLKYDDAGRENFLPTNLRLGGGFDFIFDSYNKVSVTAEVTKLLVPTPAGKKYESWTDSNENRVADPGEGNGTGIPVNSDGDVYDEISFGKGLFQSFGDAPGGFSEELDEFTWALSAEYLYQDSFALRAGYFNENELKGARKFFSIGAGFKYSTIDIDLSYLFSAAKVQSPLENTLRFSLAFNFGDGEYVEY
jgi:hypothetical protein